jgi:hypothetical protein
MKFLKIFLYLFINLRYWPEGKKARYTYYIVESTTEFCCEGFVMRYESKIVDFFQ